MRYEIQMPLPGGESWFTVCSAVTPEAAAEVVRCLLLASGRLAKTIMIVTVEID